MALIPPLFKPRPLTLRLTSKSQLTNDVCEYRFEVMSPTDFHFEPGQFVNIDIPNPEKKTVRSYSIASSPHQSRTFTLCIKLINGPGSAYFQTLEAGATIQGSGPFGLFTVKDSYTEDLLFVGTGTGVAPLKGMMEYQIEHHFGGRMSLFFGVRHVEDVFYDELFKGMAQTHKTIDYVLTVSRPDENWKGHSGRVTDLIKTSTFTLNTLRVFVCGNGDMIKEVVDMFKEMGLSEEKIHHEKFY